jgi:sulfatase modifying factor 1
MLVGCGSSSGTSVDAPGGGDDDAVDAAAPDAAGPCPANTAEVATTTAHFCIDRYEGALEEQAGDGTWSAASPYLVVGARTVRAVPAAGITPQGYISGAEAQAACMASGKRLCTTTEWLAACRGPMNTVYPYGQAHIDGACNDAYSGSPVIDYFGMSNVFDSTHMNDPGINMQPNSVAKGGEYTQCVSSDGVFDLHGNLHEWVDDPAGTFRGGFYADASLTIRPTTTTRPAFAAARTRGPRRAASASTRSGARRGRPSCERRGRRCLPC